MVWRAFAGGKMKTCDVAGRQSAWEYKQTLESLLVPFADQDRGLSSVFQQYGASIHRAHVVTDWFNEEDMVVLGWPFKSPVLKPIQDLWEILARKV